MEDAREVHAAAGGGDRETLVLSAGYEPMARVDWRRAMGMWVAGRVDLVDTYPDAVVRTVRAAFPVPSVVRFRSPAAWRRVFVRFCRDNVYVRDGGRCQYCGHEVGRARATWDHVVPKSRGGRTSWENVALACKPCNQRKGSRTPEEAGMRLARRPARPRHLASIAGGAPTFHEGMPESWRPWLAAQHERES